MSVEAITWALRQPIQHSSAKFVLVVLANCASADTSLAWPSVAYLSSATGQDRKTVTTNLQRLQEWGLIEDTGKRAGTTKQIVVYKLVCGPDLFAPTEEKRNSSENGTVPVSAGKSTVFPQKAPQKRDTEPSGNNKNPNSLAQRSALRFDEWFKTYPKRVGRKRALEKWKAKGLDAQADALIADVQRRMTDDGRWLDGFIPDPLTYLTGERWNDELLPRRAVVPGTAPAAATTAPAPAQRDWRKPPEDALQHRLAYLRQQHSYGAYGDGEEGQREYDRLCAEAREAHEKPKAAERSEVVA